MAERERTLKALDKALIVREHYRAKVRGETEEGIAEIRRILAKELGANIGRIRTTGAWLEIRPQKISERGLRSTDIEAIRSLVGLACSSQQRSVHIQEAVEIFGLPLEVIRFITEGTRKELEDLLKDPAKTDAVRTKVPSEILQQQFEPVKYLQESGGAHVDYGTEGRKGRWRTVALKETIADFLPTKALRANADALCLPGVGCWELDVYRDLEFSAPRVIAVEGGDRLARAQFALNARDYGRQHNFAVNAQAALLEEVVEKLKGIRLRVVSSDYGGSVSRTNIATAAKLPLAERALHITNTWTRRERRSVQEDLEWFWQGLVDEELAEQNLERVFRGEPLLTELEEYRSYSLSEIGRELSPLHAASGILRREHWGLGGKIASLPMHPDAAALSSDYEQARLQENVRIPLGHFVDKLIVLLNQHGLLRSEHASETRGMLNLRRMFNDVMFGKNYITKLRKFSYESDVNKSGTYYTDVAVIHTPLELYQDEDVRKATEFLFKCVEAALKLLCDSPADPTILDRFSLSLTCRGEKPTRQDTLLCQFGDKPVATRPVRTFFSAARKCQEYREREGTYATLKKQLEAPRIRIE